MLHDIEDEVYQKDRAMTITMMTLRLSLLILDMPLVSPRILDIPPTRYRIQTPICPLLYIIEGQVLGEKGVREGKEVRTANKAAQ
jgi:hypothetical protein